MNLFSLITEQKLILTFLKKKKKRKVQPIIFVINIFHGKKQYEIKHEFIFLFVYYS